MDNRKIFIRTSLILQRLKKSPATLREINDYLERHSNQYSEDFRVSERTIGRDLGKIRSMHQIEVQYDYSKKVYKIDNEGQPEANQRMMESIETMTALKFTEGISALVLFENRQSMGTENLFGLLHAIKNCYQISFSYQKYFERGKTYRTVEPYGLREYRNRWYLVVKEVKEGEQEYIKNFGLDRITNLEISKKHFHTPKDFNLSEYFRYSFGSIVPYDGIPEVVVLSYKPYQGKYVKSTPIHSSQQILIDNDKELRIQITVHITHDLKSEILSSGSSVKVIHPVELAEWIRDEHLSSSQII